MVRHLRQAANLLIPLLLENDMKYISSRRIRNYLGRFGVQPLVEYEEGAYYSPTPKLFSLLDRYQIENYIIPNKL